MRLDLALLALHPTLSRRRARAVIEGGQVSVNGATVQEAGRDVEPPRDLIAWNVNLPLRKYVRCSLPLLHEDVHCVVVDKPAGLLTVPSHADARGEDTVVGRLRDWAAVKNPRRPYIGVVHRLDRDTSGALAFALTPQSRSAMIGVVSAHRFDRRYACLVRGEPREAGGVVDLPLDAGWVGGRRRVARPDDEEATRAVTRWRVVERFKGAAMLEVELETGRQHQIRLHLTAINLPVLGDPVYRGEEKPRGTDASVPGSHRHRLPPAPRQMLHAWRLAFVHPLTGIEIRTTAPLPADFDKVLRTLRRTPAPTR